MQKSPFSRLMDEIDNDVMTLLGSTIHKRYYEEKELRDALNKTIGNISEKYQKIAYDGHPVEGAITGLISNMAAASSRNQDFYPERFFSEECDIYRDTLKPYIESLDEKEQNSWNELIDRDVFGKGLHDTDEYRKMILEMAELIPEKTKAERIAKEEFIAVINELLPEDKERARANLKEIHEDTGISAKEKLLKIYNEAIVEKNPEAMARFAKEIDGLSRTPDGRIRAVAQISTKEKQKYSYFAVLSLSQSEKKLTIEESVRKMNEATKGAIARFKAYSLTVDGVTLNMNDIFGVRTPLERFEERMKQAELAAGAKAAKSKNTSKIQERLKEDHNGTVIEVLQSHLEAALKKNKIKECREYIQDLYGGMMEAVKEFPELTAENAMFANLANEEILGRVHEFVESMSLDELQGMYDRFDVMPEELVTEEFREFRTFCAEVIENKKEHEHSKESERERIIEEE